MRTPLGQGILARGAARKDNAAPPPTLRRTCKLLSRMYCPSEMVSCFSCVAAASRVSCCRPTSESRPASVTSCTQGRLRTSDCRQLRHRVTLPGSTGVDACVLRAFNEERQLRQTTRARRASAGPRKPATCCGRHQGGKDWQGGEVFIMHPQRAERNHINIYE